MKGGKPIIAVYDTKPYDRDFLTGAHLGRLRLDPALGPAAVND